MSGNQGGNAGYEGLRTIAEHKAVIEERDKQLGTLRAGLVGRDLASANDDFDPVAVVLAALDAVTGERDKLQRSLSAQKGQTTRARNEAEALEAQLPKKPRNFGFMRRVEDYAEFQEMAKLASSEGELELAFVSAKGIELEGVAPRTIQNVQFKRLSGRGLQLVLPNLSAEVPSNSDQAQQLAGYVLLAAGEVIGCAKRSDPLELRPGRKLQLAGDVVF